MPVATPFNALGAGNGFPFCPTRVDVDTHDKWTSLSGWSKVNEPVDAAAKAVSIAESLTAAMKLFWNLNGFNGSGVRSDDLGDAFYAALTLDMYAADYDSSKWRKTVVDSDVDVNREPDERICYTDYSAGKEDPYLGGWVAIGVDILIVRMYDSNVFVGYGVAEGFAKGCATVTTIFLDSLDLVSYANVGAFEPSEYVDFDGMHFLAAVSADDVLENDTIFSISVIGDNVVGSYSSVTSGITATMTIEPFDFYTYP